MGSLRWWKRSRTAATLGDATIVDSSPVGERGWRKTFGSLANPPYRMLWSGMLLAMAGHQVDIVARAWLAYHISGSAFLLGVVALSRGISMLVSSPLAGLLADRFDKRKLLILSHAGLAVVALTNAILVYSGLVQVWHLAVIGFVQGALFPFSYTPRQALIPELVDTKHLPNAVALTSSTMNLNRVLGPAIGGLLLAWDPAIAFFAIAAIFTSATFTLYHLPRRPIQRGATNHTIHELATGARYIWNHSVLRILLGLAFVVAFVGMPFTTLLPVFQVAVLHVGPAELGVLYTSAGVGALVGSLIAARISDHSRRGYVQLALGIGFGLSLVAFSLSSNYTLSVALLSLVGLTGQGFSAINMILITVNTDRKLYGRVHSTYLMTWSLNPIAMLLIGAVTDLLGAPVALTACGLLLAGLMVAAGIRYPRHWKPREPEPAR